MAPNNTNTAENIFRTLTTQLDKLARHNRQGSYQTKERYYEACKRICRFMAVKYHLQKLSNISGKHLTAYVEYLQTTDKSASAVKTDLSAIRFFHDKMENAKYHLPDNSELSAKLEKRTIGRPDRSRNKDEFDRILAVAIASVQDDYSCAICLARFPRLWLHERVRAVQQE